MAKPGQQVKAARERLGMTVGECERALDIHSGMLAPIERCERGVSVKTACLIRDVLGIPVDVWARWKTWPAKPKSRIRRAAK